MAYTSAAAIRSYLGADGTGDDTLLTALANRASAAIDQFCRRPFAAAVDATRYYTVGKDTDGRMLYLDADLCQITTIKTDADAASPVTLAAADYITHPRNLTPWHSIELKMSSDESWTYTDDAADGIEIVGRWAYSLTPPDDIVHAAVRLSAFYYRQKDAQVFDTTAIPEAGVITVPQGLPRDIRLILEPYRRVEMVIS